jgi:hypothetical protein
VPRPTTSGGGQSLPRAYDAAPDNQHLVVAAAQARGGNPGAARIEFVLNSFDELKNRVK